MPQPFRAVAPPPITTEKILLLQSQNLNLAFKVDLVQEVLLKASVTLEAARSITRYRDESVPVILGRKSCPPATEITLSLIKISEIKGGLVAIACTNIPYLIAINPLDWQTIEFDTSPWQSDGKAYNFNGVIYSQVIGVLKKS